MFVRVFGTNHLLFAMKKLLLFVCLGWALNTPAVESVPRTATVYLTASNTQQRLEKMAAEKH